MPVANFTSANAGGSYPKVTPWDPSAVTWSRVWFRQPKPYHKPLYYSFYKSFGLGATSIGTFTPGKSYLEDSSSTFFGTDPKTEAMNKALSKLRDSLGDSSQLGASIAEYRSSFDMIALRAGQLRKAYSALRRGRLGDVYQALTISGRKTPQLPPASLRRLRLKDYGGAWLEYWFGWAPLADDIHKSVRIISGGPNYFPNPQRGFGRAEATKSYSTPDGMYTNHFAHSVRVRALCSARFTVSDPHRAMAANLGLTNYASIAWELIPWSWLVDWFVNIGQYLDSFDWWTGYSLSDAYSTLGVESRDYVSVTHPTKGLVYVYAGVQTFKVVRTPGGLPSVKVRAKIPDRLSLTRAATSVALLIQQLKH